MTITTRSPGASGCLFVVAAPSGGGKSSMVNALLEREPGIRLSVSYTTRPPRPGESEGHHYPFIDVRQLGWARVGVNALGVMGIFVALGWVVVGLDRVLGRRRSPL